MRFADIEGNVDIVRVLKGMVDSGRIPHAILFHEDDGGGAVPIALSFLQYLYCRRKEDGDSCGACPSCNKISKMIHPDVHFIFPLTAGNLSTSYYARWRELVHSNPYFTEYELNEALGIEGKSSIIAVGESKELISKLSLYALEGGYRSVIIYLPEKMNQEAANRLLKLIEEPPAQTQFLLITHAPEKVLTTIASRCQRLRIQPRSAASMKVSEDMAGLLDDLMDALTAHKLSEALVAGDSIAALPSREAAKMFCRYASDCMRKMFLCQQGLGSLAADSGNAAVWASLCRKTFPRHALEAFDRAFVMIDRNVNVKIIFTELVDTLFQAV